MTAWIARANEYTLKLFAFGFCSSSALSVSCSVNNDGISSISEIHILAASLQFSGYACFLLLNKVERQERAVQVEVHCSGLDVSSGQASAFHIVRLVGRVKLLHVVSHMCDGSRSQWILFLNTIDPRSVGFPFRLVSCFLLFSIPIH